MKTFFIKAGWLLTIILAVVILTLIFTGIIQKSMEGVAAANGCVIPDSILFGVSGTVGSGLAAIALWCLIRFIKRLGFYQCALPADTLWRAVFILLTVTLCKVVLPGVWVHFAGPAEGAASPSSEPVWMMLLFGVLLAPFFEELLFRMDVFSLLIKRFSLRWTVVLTALLFALVHGYSLQGFVSCLVAGLCFSILMARTGSLITCVIAHMLCNLEAFGFTMLEHSGSPLIMEINGHTTYNYMILTISALLMVGSVVYLYRKRA